MSQGRDNLFDVFFSHSHNHAETVELIARKLQDSFQFNIWLDKWILVPGEPFRQAISKGIDDALTCAVFVGSDTPKGWFEDEIGKALNKQSKLPSFRVIPVLLPYGDPGFISDFLELRTWVNFKNGLGDRRSMHELVSGIQGKAPGRDYEPDLLGNSDDLIKKKLFKINQLHDANLIETSIKIEFQRILLNKYLDQENDTF